MSNSEILKYAEPDEKKPVEDILRERNPPGPFRDVAVVAVMCQPHECPPWKMPVLPESDKAPPSYTGGGARSPEGRGCTSFIHTGRYTAGLNSFTAQGHPVDKVELSDGGTFPPTASATRNGSSSKCLEAMVTFGSELKDLKVTIPGYNGYVKVDDAQKYNESSPVRCVGMTFETRPDYCREEDVDRMLGLGLQGWSWVFRPSTITSTRG